MKIALLSTLLFALAPWQPEPSQYPKTLTLTTTDGETVTAQVLAVTGDSAKLKVSVLGGSMTVTRKLDGRVRFAVGDRVPVRYLPSHPFVSVLVGHERRHDAS